MSERIAFIGGGNMASAIIGGLLKQGVAPAHIQVVEPFDEARAKLKILFGIDALSAPDASLARAGLVVIGGEGALVLGGLACAALPYAVPLPDNIAGTALVFVAGALAGALWIALVGWLRQYRGINETISSLLLAYIAIGLFKHLVEH